MLLCNVGLFAQRSITLDDAIQIAIKNNSDLKQSKMDIDKANATVDATYANAYPSLDLSASYAYIIKGQQVAMPDFAAMFGNAVYGILYQEHLIDKIPQLPPAGTSLMSMTQDHNLQAQLQLTQIIFNSAVFTGIGAAKDYLDVSKYQYNAKVGDVVLNVKQAFYGILYSKAMLDIINASYQNAQANLKNVQALYNQGMVSEFNQLDASVQVENIRPQIKQLENAVVSATNGLKILLGIPQNESISAEGQLEYVAEDIDDLNSLTGRAVKNNLNLQTLEESIDIMNASVKVSESDYYPTLAAFANYGYTAMGNSFGDLVSFPTSQAGLSFSMNLFKGMSTKNQVQEAKIDVLKTEEQIDQLKQAVIMQVTTNVNELQRIKEDIEAQDRNIQVAQRAYELAGTRYKEGTGSQLEIQNSELSLRQARTNRLQSVYNYLLSKIQLDNLLGDISDSWKIK
jgi:outer membrane protein TolC